jgi:hypothetical protein
MLKPFKAPPARLNMAAVRGKSSNVRKVACLGDDLPGKHGQVIFAADLRSVARVRLISSRS